VPNGGGYALLPFRFLKLDTDRYVAVNEVGEHLVLEPTELQSLVRKEIATASDLYHIALSKHFIHTPGSTAWRDLLVLKSRSKRCHVANFTRLHMFVVTLRCDHSCKYCQVSRQNEDTTEFDMDIRVADRAIGFAFRSPAPRMKFEFQGGEPLLNFELIKHIVRQAKERNVVERRELDFVIATNLSRIDDEILSFCREHAVAISTSLDGPEDLHNANRPNSGHNSHEVTIQGIQRTRNALGADSVTALMTTTRASLSRVKDIIDEYVRQGFRGIFLRNLSPFGFAIKGKAFQSYDGEEWLAFYREGLNYILELNKTGVQFTEYYASLLLHRILTPYGTGYVNLQSPAGIGIAGIIYNYDGEVYPSDEARMKAAMGDKVFRMGNLLENSYEEIMLSPALIGPLSDSLPESVPMCEECAFLPYCGADPDYHYATQKDFVGHKALSGFCSKHMGLFRFLIQKMEDDPEDERILRSWLRA
jgi:uncharacterized protein